MVDAKLPLRTRVLNVFRAPLRGRTLDGLLSYATRGKMPTSLWARVPPSHILYARPSARRAVRAGIVYDLDISDFMEWVIYYGIATEPRDKLYGLASAGDTVLDVGANVGECALNFSRRVGPTGRVLAFEPGPSVRAKLERNVSLNGFATNIDIMALGLGDAPATLQLCEPSPHNRGGNRILERPVGEHVAIRVVRLDDFVAEHGLERVDLVKIDVEGFEVRALRGARQTLERFRPTLFVEVSEENLRGSGTSARELVGFLAELGYALRSADDGATVTPDDRFEGRHFDVIATAS
ncbi:MAG: FkbM family methyltransferase [Labilithrix sp.]|nr:FkbM family methyltransferase [Labilithrix sp.]